MGKQKTGADLLTKVANTPGFTVRPGKGSLVVVRNTELRRQRSIHGLDSGREYQNDLKKLGQIGWTEELHDGTVQSARAKRIERAKVDDKPLEELTGLPVYEPPKPRDPKKDPKIDTLLRFIFESSLALNKRAHELRYANQSGKIPTGDQVMDLILVQCHAHNAVMDLAEELRRRGISARSLS